MLLSWVLSLKRIVLFVIALVALSSCVNVVLPPDDPSGPPTDDPSDPPVDDPAPETSELAIDVQGSFEITAGGVGYTPLSFALSREAEVVAWVEETVIELDDVGFARGLEPIDEGVTTIRRSLVFDPDVSRYVIAMDPFRFEGLELQFDIFNDFFEVFERDGGLYLVNRFGYHSVMEDEPALFGSTQLSLVETSEIVTRDDGIKSVVIRFSQGDDTPMVRTLYLERLYAIAPGVSIEFEGFDDPTARFRIEGYGLEQNFAIDIGTSVEVDLGIYEATVSVLGVMLDQDTRKIATLETDEGSFSVGQHDMFSIEGRIFVVDSVITGASVMPDGVLFIESEHIVRIADGVLERWTIDGWAVVEHVDASLVMTGGDLTNIMIAQQLDEYHDDAMLGSFVLRYRHGERLISTTDAYVNAVMDGNVWLAGMRPGSYSLIVEASDGDETVRETVALTVLPR